MAPAAAWWRWLLAAVAVYAALLAAHAPLLHLPYYWDEAGYFIPAALDLFRHGWWIPRTTLANGHPPLFLAVLAVAWHVFGVSITATRATALAFAAALILATAQLARMVAVQPPVPGSKDSGFLAGRLHPGWLAAVWLALTPLCFAQASLAQLDLPAAALALWALLAWARGRRWAYAGLAAAACLTKETALLIPLVLGAFALVGWRRRRGPAWPTFGPHLIPAAALLAWLAYYHSVTGFWMGNASFLAYNLSGALSPPRVAMALALRVWQIAGYDGMAAITVAAIISGWLCRRARRPSAGSPRQGPAAAHPRRELWVIVAAYVVFHALVGGAVLARYLLPAIAIYIALLAPHVAALPHRRLRAAIVGAVAAFLIAGWFWNPPYPFPYEDNLAYATFVRLQQRAIARLCTLHPEAPVLTAWPATNELTDPDLGYVRRPWAVAPVTNFSPAAIAGHRLAAGQYALLYSRIYQPPDNWARRLTFWGRWKRRYFHYRPPLTPPQLWRRLGGHLRWRAATQGQWVLLAEGGRPVADIPEPNAGRTFGLGKRRGPAAR
ncbi:MAG: hypothetical protein ACRD2E_08230 [Terriglobales bacterium]